MAVVPAELWSSNVTIDNLPDELLREVMLRVPTPAALVHAAAVSKRWRGVITSRTGRFLDDYRERHKSSPFLGLYIQREFGGLPSFQKADSIQSADDCDLDLQRAAAKAFNLGSLESHPEWRLLDCYNGRLLLARGDESLEVYNPLSCERILVRLPRDGILPNYFSACLLQGHDDDAASFRVVSVQHDRRRRYRIVRAVEYDSRKKSWKDHPWDFETLKNIEGTEQGEMMHAGNYIFCKYTGTSLLLLDTRKMQFSALPLPADNNWKQYSIGEMEDGVCCLASVDSAGIWNSKHLRLWKLEKLEWKLEKEMHMEQVLGKDAHGRCLFYKVHAVTNGIALLGSSSSRHQLHLVVDLKTFFVKDKFEFKDLAFPMQMPWPPAFSVATVSAEQSAPSISALKNTSLNFTAGNANVVNEAQIDVYAMMNHGTRDGNNDKCPELIDGAAPQNCMPSNAPEGLNIQDPGASVPTPTAAEECFEKENDVPNDYDLQALSPHIQERKHNWGPSQVCIKRERYHEDWDDSEGENPGSCESDSVSLEGITDFQDYMKFPPMDSSNQCGNGVSESNTLVIPGQGGDEHGDFNGRLWERVSVQVVHQSEDSLEPGGAICTGVQDPHALETDLVSQYVDSKLNKDPEIPCNDDVVILGCSDVYDSHDNGPELGDEGCLRNCVPSSALKDFCIQETITTAPAPVPAEECFDKDGNIPNDHDLEAQQIPVQDVSICVMWGKTYSRRRKKPQENKTISLCHQLPAGFPPPATTLCDEDSGLIHDNCLDGAASQNCMPSNAPEGLNIQDPGASVPTPTAAEECFEKENDVPNDYDLQALSPHIQERKHNWGPSQVCIKRERCHEDWDDSEGENPGSCESDSVSLEGITDFQDYMKFPPMDSSNQCGNTVSESNTLMIPGQGGDEHGDFNGRVRERVSVQVVRQSEDFLEPGGAICIGVQDPHALETDLVGQYVESKLHKDPEIPCNDDVATLGCSDVYDSHDNGPELGDEGCLHNCVPSNAPKDFCIQEAITTAPTLVRAEECFDKDGNIPNDHDLGLEAQQIPVQDPSLCVMWGKTYSRRRKKPQENKTISLCHQLPAGSPPPATTLCDEDSGLIHTEAEAQSNECLSSNAARAQREPQRRSNREHKPNPRVKGPDWRQ
ncbi:uncharacterized protein C2845_PM03G15020 [Panicum miliaceum]|uniref:F-box domain-containing protein n=1 Tax=Panicum miliaceum TaxID=4540 RepID=A0A3L6T4K5_PANMI|nr:uncharacterized protein C2845_PM03G15020 [Panicum miliaceum]